MLVLEEVVIFLVINDFLIDYGLTNRTDDTEETAMNKELLIASTCNAKPNRKTKLGYKNLIIYIVFALF